MPQSQTSNVQSQFAGILSMRSKGNEIQLETTEDVEKYMKKTRDSDGKRFIITSESGTTGYDTVYFDPKGSVEISDKFATYFVMCNFKGCKKIYSNKNRGGGHLSKHRDSHKPSGSSVSGMSMLGFIKKSEKTSKVHNSISQFGTLCLSADYGTRFDDYIAVNASYLIQNANHLELKTNLIGLMKVTGERKTTSNILEHVKKATMMILDENDLMLATWMSDGAANIRKIGESFIAGTVCTAHLLQLAAFRGFIPLKMHTVDEQFEVSDSEDEGDQDKPEEPEESDTQTEFEVEEGDENLDAEEEWLPLSIDFKDDEGIDENRLTMTEQSGCKKAESLLDKCSKLNGKLKRRPKV
ncbi:hypothetical protein WR25_12184 isoform J [Diploscapter pachys]|uniref:Uncharacterized protein n=1 Tax=Diploscapter pachys TaxID=2018661 RepID=A0A2A2K671_9BILA|nr:hypothetical protein WR25_12184 isoform B [Diploscapter pachys]PAV69393.1 hypothetical protein WR25_12184 isoform C [Diploscapter pachys]PAV69400.1 hypothetical protein WR25_12184 isoform J [Diploscapter pachys]